VFGDVSRGQVVDSTPTDSCGPALEISAIRRNGVRASTLLQGRVAKELLNEADDLHRNYSASL
jgi:hypothetical protein